MIMFHLENIGPPACVKKLLDSLMYVFWNEIALISQVIVLNWVKTTDHIIAWPKVFFPWIIKASDPNLKFSLLQNMQNTSMRLLLACSDSAYAKLAWILFCILCILYCTLYWVFDNYFADSAYYKKWVTICEFCILPYCHIAIVLSYFLHFSCIFCILFYIFCIFFCIFCM